MTAREAQITSPPPSLGTGTTITPRRSSGGSCFLKIWLRFGNILHSFWRGENVRAEQSAVGPARTRPGPGNGELSVAGGSGHTEPGAPPGPDPVKTSYSHRTRWSLPPRPQAQWGRRLAACPVQCAQKSRALFLAVCFGMSEAHSDPRQARLAFHSHLRSAAPPGTGRAHAQRPGADVRVTWQGCLRGLGTLKICSFVPDAKMIFGSFLLACLPHLRAVSC